MSFISSFSWLTLTGGEEDKAVGTLDVLALRSSASSVGAFVQKLLPAAEEVELLLGLLLVWTSRLLVAPTHHWFWLHLSGFHSLFESF